MGKTTAEATVTDATRLSKLRERIGLTLAEFGEVFCCSGSQVYKMEAGLRPVTGLRRLVLDALEEAVSRRSLEVVWGPRVPVPARHNPAALPRPRIITPRQRLARIFAAAHPEITT